MRRPATRRRWEDPRWQTPQLPRDSWLLWRLRTLAARELTREIAAAKREAATTPPYRGGWP